MKEIRIKSKIINNDDKVTKLDILGNINEEDNTISYIDDGVLVNIVVSSDKIVINRRSDEHNIELIFNKNEEGKSLYSFYNPKMTFDLNTVTKELIIKKRHIYIKYQLKLNGGDMGIFEFDLKWEE